MSLLKDIRAHLVNDSGVNAITSTVRLYRSNQSDTLPRVVLHTISEDHKHHMLAATGKVISRIQIDCLASLAVNAEALAEAIRQSLDGFRGTLNSNIFVSMCHLDSVRSNFDPPHEGQSESGGVDMVQLDYMIGWTVSIPTFS